MYWMSLQTESLSVRVYREYHCWCGSADRINVLDESTDRITVDVGLQTGSMLM